MKHKQHQVTHLKLTVIYLLSNIVTIVKYTFKVSTLLLLFQNLGLRLGLSFKFNLTLIWVQS